MPSEFEVTTRQPASDCPVCRKKLDAASGEGKPRPGDMTVCAYCAELAVFGEDLELRVPNGDEVEEFYSNPAAARMQAVMRQIVERRSRA